MAGELHFDALGPGDYERAKAVLNKAKHPGFVGRELFFRCATTGTCTIAVLDGVDVGVLLVASQKAQALSVVQSAQGSGVGAGLIDRVQPRWASVMQERVEWFRRRGYSEVGPPKVSQKGTTSMQLMERVAEPKARAASPTTASPDAAPRAASSAPLATTDSGRNATGLALVWQQLEHAEQLTASLCSRMQATDALMRKWGLTRRRARALQAAVAKRLRTEGQLESRDQRLERYRLALEQQHAKADADGDRKACIAALAVLVKLEGDAPPPPELPPGEYLGGGEVQVVDREDMHETLRALRAQQNGNGGKT